MNLLEGALSCNFTSGAAAVISKLTRRNSEVLGDFNKCLKSMLHFNYFFQNQNGFQTVLVAMIANSQCYLIHRYLNNAC